jgi:anhydro-N-acetylmuramic acid kinase
LLSRLQEKLPYPVKTTDALSINPNAIEAMMCAWLGKQRIENQPIKLSQITGAKKDSVLGGIWHP